MARRCSVAARIHVVINHYHAILRPGCRDAEITAAHILHHRVGIALCRQAITARAGSAHFDHVTRQAVDYISVTVIDDLTVAPGTEVRERPALAADDTRRGKHRIGYGCAR